MDPNTEQHSAHHTGEIDHLRDGSIDRAEPAEAERPTRLPSLLMGLGLGAFVDGIVLHQILQWHHMLTDEGGAPMDTVAGLERNTVADGVFHAVAWVLVVVGALMLFDAWRERRLAPPWRRHIAMLLVGWGVFNVVEGLVNHHLLGLHHVRDDLGGPRSWDLAFLMLGAALVVAGWLLARTRESTSR